MPKKSIHDVTDASLERMRRTGAHNAGHPGGPSEFHLDVPQIPIWQSNAMPPPMPLHMQLLPTTLNGHHAGIEHLMNSGGDQLDREYLHVHLTDRPSVRFQNQAICKT